jgi:GTP pyrophosphokinase
MPASTRRVTEPTAKAKSMLAAVAIVDSAGWLELVTVGRSSDDVALLTAVAAATQDFGHAALARMHALRVGQILHDLQMDAQTVASGTIAVLRTHEPNIALPDLAASLGSSTMTLVEAVERLRAVPDLLEGPRDQHQLDRLRRLFLTLVSDVRAAIVVLAEWLHHMRELVSAAHAADHGAANLTLDVYAPLASRLGIWQVKWELEDLALRCLHPDVYRDIARQLAERRIDRERYIDNVVEQVEQALAAAGIKAQVAGRPKSIYSIWRKMRSKSLRFDDIYDVRAVRIVTETVASCYAALGVVHGLWTHVSREFDDYIANPKSNRYQSLHTAVVGPEERTVEVQIRTEQMHRDAELGVAAHWRYKEANGGAASSDERVAWLRQALEWREQLSDGELHEQLQLGVADEKIYVLTPKGRVLDLPQGATPLDFAYSVHTDVGHRCRGARVNGHMVALTTALHNGDTVQIMTARRSAPSRDWLSRDLGYLTTSRARSKVRHWFRQLDFEQNVTDGREAWEREVRRLRLPTVQLDSFAEQLNFLRADDLFAAIGRSEVQLGQIANAVRDAFVVDTNAESQPTPVARRRAAPAEFSIDGVGTLLVQVASCCAPVPPEPIFGYVTRGRGVTVHRSNCTNLNRLMEREGNRVIEVQWRDSTQMHAVELLLKAYDRRGLIRDVSAVVANIGLDVRGIESKTDETSRIATMRIWLDVRDAAQLSRLIGRLLQVRNVFEALRHG